ncbi:unnamed protein product [Lepidochelys kempii]
MVLEVVCLRSQSSGIRQPQPPQMLHPQAAVQVLIWRGDLKTLGLVHHGFSPATSCCNGSEINGAVRTESRSNSGELEALTSARVASTNNRAESSTQGLGKERRKIFREMVQHSCHQWGAHAAKRNHVDLLD